MAPSKCWRKYPYVAACLQVNVWIIDTNAAIDSTEEHLIQQQNFVRPVIDLDLNIALRQTI
jgi:hypothetical protein